MIFINAQGHNATSTENILDILEILDFDSFQKVKTKNINNCFQVIVLKNHHPVCFINFISGNARAKFIKIAQEEYEITEIMGENQ